MQAHKGIEDEQARGEPGDCRIEGFAIDLEIEPHGGSGDHLHVEIGEREASGRTDAFGRWRTMWWASSAA